MDEPSRSAQVPVEKNLELPVLQKSVDPAHYLQRNSAAYQGQEQVFLPHAVVCSRQVEDRHDRPLRLAVLKAVTNILGLSEKLVFTAFVLPKACLGVREQATGFSEVVESMRYHTFQGLNRTKGQIDRAERIDVASRFPHLEQRDDGGVSLVLWHFSLVEALVEDRQQFLFRDRPEGFEERRRDIIRTCGTSVSHFFDGAVEVIQIEVDCGAIVDARGLHPSLCFSDAVAFGFGELQFADLRVVGS